MAAITDADVRRYVDDGYLVVPDLVSQAELDGLKAEAARFARGEYPISNPVELPEGASDDDAMRSILAVHFPHWVSPVVQAAVTHAGIAEVLHRITAAHLPHWDGAVKCMQSMLFIKPPGLQGQAWHQDERFIPTRDRSLLGAWIALDDANVENGCLMVRPGSHRNGYIWPTKDHGKPDEFDVSDEAYGFDDSDQVPVEVSAGSVVFFNGYLLHRSFRNRSDRYRRALVNHYCNAWSLLPWGAAGQQVNTEAIGTADFRIVVPLGPDPYEARGYIDPPKEVFLRPNTGTWFEHSQARRRGIEAANAPGGGGMADGR